MLVLIAVLLALIPAAAILYPFVFRRGMSTVFRDETSTYSELTRRWEAAIAGLKNTELEHAIGNLTQEDYHDLREQYMLEAANIMKAMELEDQAGRGASRQRGNGGQSSTRTDYRPLT